MKTLSVRAGIGWLAVLGVAWVIAGGPGLAFGAVAIALAVRVNGRAVVAGAMVALAVAAVATVVDPWLRGEVLFEFSVRHRLAAEAGRGAGVMLLVAIVAMVIEERTAGDVGPDEPRL